MHDMDDASGQVERRGRGQGDAQVTGMETQPGGGRSHALRGRVIV